MENSTEKKRLEAQLISLAKSGDKDAFCLLAKEHQERVFHTLRKMLKSSELAEDLTQEVFLKAFKGISSFKEEAKFSTWLTRIALNEASNYFKSKTYREKKETVDNSVNFFETLSAPKPEEADYQLRLQQVKVKLGDLKPKYRDVIVLYSIKGQSYKEISEILEIPLGTVKSRMNMALNILRKELGGES